MNNKLGKEKFVQLINVNKYYENGMHAVVDFNLDIAKNEFIVFVGPSGCGKSTTLRMVAGLEDISGGELIIEGKVANDLEPVDRDVAMVFQSYALYPNMTIYQNMSFPLEMRKDPLPVVNKELCEALKAQHPEAEKDEKLGKWFSNEGLDDLLDSGEFDAKLEELNQELGLSLTKADFLKVRHYNKKEIDKRVRSAAEILEIADQLNKKPKALSGGQRQRVALGRAIVRQSHILLMDEPLSNLDAKLRVYMRSEIVKLHQRTNSTTIYVTHDQTEAMTMADRIVVMSKGYVQQIGSPEEIYKHPKNIFVASFIGSPAMNFVDATLVGKELVFNDGHKLALDEKSIQEVKEFYKNLLEDWTSYMPKYREEREAQLAREFKAKKHRRGKTFSYVDEEDPEMVARKDHLAKISELVEKGDEYPLTFGIRPESIKESDKGEEFTAEFVELLGDEYYVHFTFGGKKCLAKVPAERKIVIGDKVKLEFVQDKLHLFDPLSTRAIK